MEHFGYQELARADRTRTCLDDALVPEDLPVITIGLTTPIRACTRWSPLGQSAYGRDQVSLSKRGRSCIQSSLLTPPG
jgi:hypothetical protein